VDIGRLLAPYATFFRYPGIVIEPSASEFKQAISAATELYEFVLSLLPAEALPKTEVIT
jgi:hypothetical protein